MISNIVCDAGDAVTLGELFSDSLIEPVTAGPADWLGQSSDGIELFDAADHQRLRSAG